MKKLFTVVVLSLYCFLISGQNVGIGTLSPSAKLHLSQNLDTAFIFNDGFEDNTLSPFTTDGDAQWSPIFHVSYVGAYSVISGEISDGQSTNLELSVAIPNDKVAYLTFYCNSDVKEEDTLVLKDNGIVLDHLSDKIVWQEYSYVIGEGSHTLRWEYTKLSVGNNDIQRINLDSISIRVVDNYALRIADGEEGEGKVLTSNQIGMATWKSVNHSGIYDIDNDTKVFVDFPSDGDFIQMNLAGKEALRINTNSNSDFIFDIGGSISTSTTFIGNDVGYNNTGSGNTFVGNSSGKENETGSVNTFIGHNAANKNVSGSFNVFLGNSTGFNNLDGYNNTFAGVQAGYLNTSGHSNTFYGKESSRSNKQGTENTSFGTESAYANQSGSQNVVVGYRSAFNNSADSIVALGYKSAYNNSSGAANTFIGAEAGTSGTTFEENVFIGFKSGYHSIRDNLTFVGSRSGYNNLGGLNNTFIGKSSGFFNTSGSDNTYIGAFAGYNNEDGHSNTAIGEQASYNMVDASLTTTVGFRAGYSASSGHGFRNTFIGAYSGENNWALGSVFSAGTENTFVGGESGRNNKTGYYNTFLGSLSGFTNDGGTYNTFVGANSGEFNVQGDGNVALGYLSYNVNGKTAYDCTFLGYKANIDSMVMTTSFTNSTAIGYDSKITADNQIRIGNSLVTSIGGYEPWSDLSDLRVKRNITENVPGLNFINKLNPVSYNIDYQYLSTFLHESPASSSEALSNQKRKSQQRQTGLIAQELEQLIESMDLELDAVTKPQNDEDLYGIKYATLVVPLIQAVQELSAEVNALKNKVIDLEDEKHKRK